MFENNELVKRAIKYLIEFLLLGAIWGSSFMLMRITAPEFGIWAVVELRALLATLVLLPFVIAKQQLGDIRIFAKPILVVALTNTAIPFSLFTYGSVSSVLYITRKVRVHRVVPASLSCGVFFVVPPLLCPLRCLRLLAPFVRSPCFP